ncbi:putative protein kinase [Trypanosoma theileri]|uniref:Protein kinase domain-containing protein n=1 Tax=Trypanosoma theileri TaxID=67003 RepID=A0A1X0NEW8_9TRYP|nr:putative protein kinase [Trypanosoma theileri]ORC79532.1 putative protein kinase [Trypanosoma theileri]
MHSDLDLVDIYAETTPLSTWLSSKYKRRGSTYIFINKPKMKRIIVPRPVQGNAPISPVNAPDEELRVENSVSDEGEERRRPIIMKRRPVDPPITDFIDSNMTSLLTEKEKNSSTLLTRSVQESEEELPLRSSTVCKEEKKPNVFQSSMMSLFKGEHSGSWESDETSDKSSSKKKDISVDTLSTSISYPEEKNNTLKETHNSLLSGSGVFGSTFRHRQNRSPQMPFDLENFEESGPKIRLLNLSTKNRLTPRSANRSPTPLSGSYLPTELSGLSSRNGNSPKVNKEKNGLICDVYASEGSGSEPASPNDIPPSVVSRLHQLKRATPTHGVCDSVDTADTPSPFPVTLNYAGQIQRKKHLKRISYYILGPLLGEGAFGVVRDAIDTSANHMIPPQFQRVAIKSFKYRREIVPEGGALPAAEGKKPTSGNSTSNSKNESQSFSKPPIPSSKQRYDKKMQRMLDDEAANLQRFHCPNIIRAIDIFTRDGKDYVVLPIAICNLDQLIMENLCHEAFQQHLNSKGTPLVTELTFEISTPSYLSMGDSLTNIFRSQGIDDPISTTFSAALIKGVMYQLLYGVVYLHRQGLAHNDLKPQNILLYADGVIKITDLGSVSPEYNDQGTPMFLSPEVCRYFYCACDDEDLKKDESQVKVNAMKNDMWSCGVILYYLLVGRAPWGDKADGRSKYQLYRRIAAQSAAMDLSHVPEPCDSEVKGENQSYHTNGMPVSPRTRSSAPFPPSSLRHLLSQLLDVNPNRRLSAEEAIQHPSLQLLHTTGNKKTGMIEAAQHDVAQQVLLSPHVRRLIKRDREQHLQFVAECCSMLEIPLPKEIFLPDQVSVGGSDHEPIIAGSQTPKRPSVGEQRGTVDRRLFPKESDYNYYEKKSGKPECDVRSMLSNAAKMKMMHDYLYLTVLVDCGYRNAEEAAIEREEALLKLQKRNEVAEANMSRLSSLMTSPASNQVKSSSATPARTSRPNTAKQTTKKSEVKKGICSDCFCGLM